MVPEGFTPGTGTLTGHGIRVVNPDRSPLPEAKSDQPQNPNK